MCALEKWNERQRLIGETWDTNEEEGDLIQVLVEQKVKLTWNKESVPQSGPIGWGKSDRRGHFCKVPKHCSDSSVENCASFSSFVLSMGQVLETRTLSIHKALSAYRTVFYSELLYSITR